MKNLFWIVIVLFAVSCTEKKDDAALIESADVTFLIRHNNGTDYIEGKILTVGTTQVKNIPAAGTSVEIERGKQYKAKAVDHDEIFFYVLYNSLQKLRKIIFQLNQDSAVDQDCVDDDNSYRTITGKVFNSRNNMALDSVKVWVGGTEYLTNTAGEYSWCFPCPFIECEEQEITYKTKNGNSVTIKVKKSGTSETTIDVFIDDSEPING